MNSEEYESLYESDIRHLVIEDYKKHLDAPIEKQTKAPKVGETVESTGSIFKKVPEELLFTDKTFWQVINESTNQEYEVNGIMVDFWLSSVPRVREMLEDKTIDTFKTLNMTVKFKNAIY